MAEPAPNPAPHPAAAEGRGLDEIIAGKKAKVAETEQPAK